MQLVDFQYIHPFQLGFSAYCFADWTNDFFSRQVDLTLLIDDLQREGLDEEVIDSGCIACTGFFAGPTADIE
jgi:hypothetical protein